MSASTTEQPRERMRRANVLNQQRMTDAVQELEKHGIRRQEHYRQMYVQGSTIAIEIWEGHIVDAERILERIADAKAQGITLYAARLLGA